MTETERLDARIDALEKHVDQFSTLVAGSAMTADAARIFRQVREAYHESAEQLRPKEFTSGKAYLAHVERQNASRLSRADEDALIRDNLKAGVKPELLAHIHQTTVEDIEERGAGVMRPAAYQEVIECRCGNRDQSKFVAATEGSTKQPPRSDHTVRLVGWKCTVCGRVWS